MNNIKVRLENTGSCIAISTYSRKHGKRGRFLIVTDNIRSWLHSAERRKFPFLDTDCGHFLTIRSGDRNRLYLTFTWLSYGREIRGISESFYLGIEDLAAVVAGGTFEILCNDEKHKGTIEWTPSAYRVIRQMNKRERSAFKKAIARGALCWPDTQTVVYSDGPKSFYFRTNDGLCGGLIRHEYNGEIMYSVHT